MSPLPRPAPIEAGLSHLENPESDPRLGGTRRSAAAATPWNRIANRPESKHELRLCPFGACSSGQLLPRKFLPYAIPLPLKGGGDGKRCVAAVFRLLKAKQSIPSPSA